MGKNTRKVIIYDEFSTMSLDGTEEWWKPIKLYFEKRQQKSPDIIFLPD